MVKLRLSRLGRTHRAFFRLNAMDIRRPRNGRIIEHLGWYDPCATDPSKRAVLKVERIRHWLSKGAQPSETVANLLKSHGINPRDRRDPSEVPAEEMGIAQMAPSAQPVAAAVATPAPAAAPSEAKAPEAPETPATAATETPADAPAEQAKDDAPAEPSSESDESTQPAGESTPEASADGEGTEQS